MTRRSKGWQPGILPSVLFGPVGSMKLQRHRHSQKLQVHMRHPHKKAKGLSTEKKCPCSALRVADKEWVQMAAADHSVWNAAVKRPHLSGYHLWMKETMTLLMQGKNFPSCPSVSGGFSCRFLQEGDKAPPETIGAAPPPPPPPPPGDSCLHCVDFTPSYIYVTISDAIPFAGWDPNGQWIVNQYLACAWELTGESPEEYLHLNVAEAGRESVMWTLRAGSYDWDWIRWILEVDTGEGQALDCYSTWILNYDASHDPANSDAKATIHTIPIE